MSLPAYFRNSPLISIDDDVKSVEQRSGRLPDTSGVNENEELQGMELHEISSEADNLSVVGEWSDAPASPPSHSDLEDSNLTTSRCLEGTVIGDELGEEKEAEVPSKESLHVATALRSNLQVLQDFTYLCKDPSSLKAIANSIERVVSDAKSLLPREGGLVLRPTPQKQKLSACGPLSQKVAGIRSLPSRTCKKKLSLFDRYKRRAGRYADMVKAAAHVPVTVEEPSQASHGSKPETTDEPKLMKRSHTLSPKPSKTTQRQLQKGKTKAKPDRKPKVAAAESVSDEVQLCGQYMQSTVYPYKKRLMTDSDFLIILSSDSRRNWLNDTIINCAQNILRQQFHPPGLYDTSLGPHLTYPRAQFFYQILHDDNHWILVSTVDCQPYSVKVYDSLFRGQLSPNIQKQTAAILRSEATEITFSVQSVQQQPNVNDCGVFAIAFLVDLLFKVHPGQFNVEDMRPHLHESLLRGMFECPFPKTEQAQQHSLPFKNIVVLVHCVCRMPHFKSDEEEQALQMAECDRCHCWYHRSCVSIPDRVFKKRDQLWYCPNCY